MLKDIYFRLCRNLLQLIPAGTRGKAQLTRGLLSRYLSLRDIHLDDRFGCEYLVPSLLEPIAFYLMSDRVYEPLVAKFILDHLRVGATFVDVGANIGVFTIPVAKRVGATGCVIAVEPSPRIATYLRYNISRNHLLNVRLQQCAAFDHEEQALSFYEAPLDHFGMGALAPQFYESAILIPARTLDNILAVEKLWGLDLLKVDCEGYESAVFRGGEQTLTRPGAPNIVFEFCDWAEKRAPDIAIGEAQRILLEYGYRIWRLRDFMRGRAPLPRIITTGCESLVAIKH